MHDRNAESVFGAGLYMQATSFSAATSEIEVVFHRAIYYRPQIRVQIREPDLVYLAPASLLSGPFVMTTKDGITTLSQRSSQRTLVRGKLLNFDSSPLPRGASFYWEKANEDPEFREPRLRKAPEPLGRFQVSLLHVFLHGGMNVLVRCKAERSEDVSVLYYGGLELTVDGCPCVEQATVELSESSLTATSSFGSLSIRGASRSSVQSPTMVGSD